MVPPKDKEIVEETPKIVEDALKEAIIEKFKDNAYFNWNLTYTEDGLLEGHNLISHEHFLGKMEDFKVAMRG
jgi:hypothetical protein